MRKMFVITAFMLALLTWAAAQQQPGNDQPGSGSEGSTSVTEGCLGGSSPNYTITDKAGTTYKLNLPPTADPTKLSSHVGESVQVAGDVKDTGRTHPSIDVQRIARGTGTCAGGPKGAQPPKQ